MGSRVIGVGLTGKSLTELERMILRQTPPWAVVLFGRNVGTAEELRELVLECKSQSDRPPLILIDQEGGRVDRLRTLFPGLPAAESFLANERTRGMARVYGRVLGAALRWFDIEINLAPVVDIQREEPTKGLERRCFGTDGETVIQLAGDFVRGQSSAGTASCLKHFPGISRGSGDPHYGTTVVDLSLEELKAADLRPYMELGKIAPAVMVGHATYPQIDDRRTPASLSYQITTGILRDVVGFEGLAISDDMEMHAVSDLGTWEEITDQALLAGNDIVMFCSHIERVPDLMEHMKKRAEGDPIFAPRLVEANRRAEAYLRFMADLRRDNPPLVDSYEELEDMVGQFLEDFDRAGGELSHVKPLPPRGFSDRRTYPRYRSDGTIEDRREDEREKGGTGPTGREEWT